MVLNLERAFLIGHVIRLYNQGEHRGLVLSRPWLPWRHGRFRGFLAGRAIQGWPEESLWF